MPSRYIREGWIDSARIDQLDAKAETFFLRLCLKADDFGRYSANPVVLKNTLYPLKDDVRVTDSSRCLAACEKAGLVRCYETIKGPVLEIQDFKQRTRASESKYPSPDESLSDKCPADARHLTAKNENEVDNENDASSLPPAVGDGVGSDFEEFWLAYPRKVGKQAALKAWNSAKQKPDVRTILAAIEQQKRCDQWQRDNGQYIPHPATWINQGRWDDQPVTRPRYERKSTSSLADRVGERMEEYHAWLRETYDPGFVEKLLDPSRAKEDILRDFLRSKGVRV